MDKTCKSNADREVAISTGRSGARVRNTWVICREDWNNLLKGKLMPDEIADEHSSAMKVGVARPDVSR